MNRTKIISITIVVLAIALLQSYNVTLASKNHYDVTICHATGSQQNPYTRITVDDDAVNGNGNSDHNRDGHQNGEDIIPPGFWDNNGRNWTTQGIAIWNNNCNVPQPTNTPTPTTIVTPTSQPTPTFFPTPTFQPSPTFFPSPTGGNGNIYDNCLPFYDICPTATPTVAPTTGPTSTPSEGPTATPAPTNKPTDAPVGGGSTQSTSSSTSSPSSSSSPSTGGGEVLGATTLATTGIFQEALANSAILIGSLLMGAGSIMYGKKKTS